MFENETVAQLWSSESAMLFRRGRSVYFGMFVLVQWMVCFASKYSVFILTPLSSSWFCVINVMADTYGSSSRGKKKRKRVVYDSPVVMRSLGRSRAVMKGGGEVPDAINFGRSGCRLSVGSERVAAGFQKERNGCFGAKRLTAAAKILRRLDEVPIFASELPEQPDCLHCGAILFFKESKSFCCGDGKISIQLPKMPESLWNLYVFDTTDFGVHFRQRCRTYNNSSAFSSLGIKYDETLCKANKGVYTFRIQGAIYHFIRDLVPGAGQARHLQLYFYGTEDEVVNRLSQSEDLSVETIRFIMDLMRVNPYANFFRNLREFDSLDSHKIILRADPSLDQRVYNLPVVDHVAVIWNEDADYHADNPRDIRVYSKPGGTHLIHYYYGCYDSLQYPLLFPFGEPGWRSGIEKQTIIIDSEVLDSEQYEDSGDAGVLGTIVPGYHSSGASLLAAEELNLQRNRRKKGFVSIREYYCFLLQIRRGELSNILRAGRLSQQFEVDQYVKLETQRLDYYKHNQVQWESRVESLQGLVDSISTDGFALGSSIGKRIVLPASFVGGPRDMRKRYLNALALVQEYGRPDLFITMTCNPKWKEIQDQLLGVEDAQNRADIISRVFKAKNEMLKELLIDQNFFGEVAAYVFVTEFQKRGLPHVHWLIILKPRYKITSTEAYDRFVCAEIPDQVSHPHLYNCVKKHMMHGPCGELNIKNVCMRGNKCKSQYPKQFSESTSHRQNCYPEYRRRDDGKSVKVRGKHLDNRWVIPYNPYLVAVFDCHINVEVCSDIKLVKYLYKYICKGKDKIAFNVADGESSATIDEISDFQSGRWLCAPEAVWRIYGFDMYDMYPSVLQLQVHLPNQQQICFSARKTVQDIVSSVSVTKTQLTEFFRMNADDVDAISMKLM